MRRLLLLLPLALTLACASSGSAPATPRGGMNVITNAEVEQAPNDAITAYDLVARLRPTMLRPRNLSGGAVGEGTDFGVIVYVEEVRLGDIEQLRTVMRATVYEIRYIGATDATTRWGTGHSSGVIQVRLKR